MIKRRASRIINVGGVEVGGAGTIVVQSMTNTDTRDVSSTVKQIKQLEECGCEIVRVAVPDLQASNSLVDIKKQSSIPVIADIHFDHRLALAALKAGVDGLRLNPGNITDPEKIKEVVLSAKEREVPIRIGVNAGSLPRKSSGESSTVQRMVDAVLEEIDLLESLDFDMIKVPAKAFDVLTSVEVYRAIADRIPYPLHLGITEAGLPWAGSIRSAVGLGILLHEGIGDTIRVSLTTSDLCKEVDCAYEILKSLKLREKGPTLVSCPSCGRSETDIVSLAEEVEQRLRHSDQVIKVAVMGCVVNGPGEAKDADVGIACGKGKGVLFKKGKKLKVVEEADFLEALMQEINSMVSFSN